MVADSTNPFLIGLTQATYSGEYVELFTIDATNLGDTVYRVTQSRYEERPVQWNGIEYVPEDILASGFDRSGQGTQARPRVKVSNVKYAFGPLVAGFRDGLRAKVTRVKTFRTFLDGEPNSDPGAFLSLDTYQIERKVDQNKYYIEFELSSPVDAEGVMLPRRQALRDICQRVPRQWSQAAGAFVNPPSTVDGCPYIDVSGEAPLPLFDGNGLPTNNPTLEAFSKQLNTCCKVRYGQGPYPTRAFPGMARTHS